MIDNQRSIACSNFRVATVAFARLERDHGEVFVRRALGYITAARKGVTFNELEDLLSLDEIAMEELTAQYSVSEHPFLYALPLPICAALSPTPPYMCCTIPYPSLYVLH